MDDKRLVSQILAGNERALRYFYAQQKPKLARFIRNKIANENDAEEVLQDVLLASIEALRDFSFRSSLSTFILSIAHHKVIDFYRRKKIKDIVFSRISDIEPLISTFFGPEESFNEVLLKEKIKKTFEKIAPKYKLILTLKYIYGFSVYEIAKKMSISFKSAESQLFRARQAFVLAYSI